MKFWGKKNVNTKWDSSSPLFTNKNLFGSQWVSTTQGGYDEIGKTETQVIAWMT